jgi:flagellar L-ring protein precursor FlgH
MLKTTTKRIIGKTKPFALIPFLLLTGCGTQLAELQNIGKPPVMAKVTAPMEKPGYEPVHWKQNDEEEGRKYSNSLWQTGSSSFFQDRKARRVGDILTVTVKVKDKAELKNETKRDRTSKDTASAPNVFGLEEKLLGIVPGVPNPSKLLDVSGVNSSDGKGEIKRDETIQTNVAAMVTQILPNGNLVVHGDQEIRVNFELRKVTIDGIIRPEDISAGNSVDSDQIAEARISYGGKGEVSAIQQPRLGNQVIDILSPF